MSFLDKNGLQVLTNKLVQGDAIKVASHRGHTVKNVIDNITRECENISTPNTMNLENRINEFKVGQGRDIDISGDVEEGKAEVELKGKTWQNLVKENSKYTQELNIKNHTGYIEANFTLKPTGTYTLFFKVSNLVKSGNARVNCVFRGNDNDNTYGQFAGVDVVEDGLNRKMFTLKNGLKNFLIGISASANKNNPTFTIGDIMILEGDHTQTPIEELPKYFEGIKSSFEDGVVDVEVQGKNLISKATEWRLGVINADTGIYSDKPSGTRYTSNLIYNPSGKELYIRSKGHMWNYLYFYDENKNYLGFCTNQGMGSNYNFNINFDNSKRIAKYFIISFGNQDALEIGEVYEYQETDYITPYKKKISFNIEEPLRSLHNGVCDEIRNSNGQWELVRRVGKVVLNGSEQWLIASNNNNIMYWNVDNIGNAKTYVAPGIMPNLICDKISITTYNTAFNMNEDSTMMCLANRNKSTADSIAIRMLNPNNHVGVLVEWLSQNPTTVYYELAEPIITPIEPMEFDVKPLATMTINSDIAPVSNHKVVLNRAGQIEQGIVQIAELKKRVDSLETAYDSYLLETQHKLSILGFEYELESEEV